jgi:uncharacterized protein
VTASNPSVADRDFESLRRAQQAHESSMDEILASIRDIIADDKVAAREGPRALKFDGGGGPQIVYRNDAIPRDAAPAFRQPSDLRPGLDAPTSRIAWETPGPVAAPTSGAAIDQREDPVVEPPLASPATDAAVAASFNTLSASIALQSSGMIDSLMREMLRPLIKSWLNDNLPSLVERLVRYEIERVARGRR